MKKFLSFLALSFCALAVNAQATHKMRITFQNGKTVSFGMDSVMTVEFLEKTPISKETYFIDGVEYPTPEAVDLGLPSGTKWASMNVGSSSPTDGGLYFAYADPIYRGDFDDQDDEAHFDYPFEYGPPSNIIFTEYDIATANIGKPWCMPSCDQLKELLKYCKFEYNHDSFYYTDIGPNNNSIILPCPRYFEPEDWHIGEYVAGNITNKFGYECQLCLYPPDPDALYIYIWGDEIEWDGMTPCVRSLVRPVLMIE